MAYFFVILFALCSIIGVLFFIIQDRYIFYPVRLKANYQFNFSFEFEERNYSPSIGVVLNSVLIKTPLKSKGVIFYLHGNAGNIQKWGSDVGEDFLNLGYDVFMYDYRSYGKSKGVRTSNSLMRDAMFMYDNLKEHYSENNIHVYGKSLGAGLAAYVSSKAYPYQLIMETPFYSMRDLSKQYFSWFPTFLLKYEIPTYYFCQEIETSIPISIFHGTSDKVISHDSSLKIKERVSHKINLFLIPRARHNNLNSFNSYHYRLKQVLNERY
ncbi:MAG: alpha/beta hydrolase [Cytophagales bacterium]|nr:alpha/beta hydrolase [Cytophagales bacterium]